MECKKEINSKHYYLVKRGDTLESISKKYKVSIKMLQQQNHIHGSIIRIGERLKVYE